MGSKSDWGFCVLAGHGSAEVFDFMSSVHTILVEVVLLDYFSGGYVVNVLTT